VVVLGNEFWRKCKKYRLHDKYNVVKVMGWTCYGDGRK
jgi:hypothetical protein